MIDTKTTISHALSKQRAEGAKEKKAAEASAYKKTLELEVAQDMTEAEFRLKDRYWAGRIGSEMVRLYPGHGWEVHCNIAHGIINIFNRHMTATAGYRLKISELNHIRLTQQLKKIGGEMLERFGLSRERFEADVVQQIQHDTKGRAKVDLS